MCEREEKHFCKEKNDFVKTIRLEGCKFENEVPFLSLKAITTLRLV